MKLKFTFLALSLAAALCANATDAFNYTFEGAANTPTTSSVGGNVSSVNASATNPVTDGINTSATCLSFAASSSVDWWEGVYINFPSSAATENPRYIYMKVRADIPNGAFNARLEIRLFNGGTDLNMPLTAIPAMMFGGTWQEYCFVVPSTATIDNFRIQPRRGGTFYIDDVRLSDVAPVIPDLKGFSCDFENEDVSAAEASGAYIAPANWANNNLYTSSDGAVTYLSNSNKEGGMSSDGSKLWMRIWQCDGNYPNYGGARFSGVFGKTTETTRYLHFKYYYDGNSANGVSDPQPIRVFTQDNDSPFVSDSCSMGQWNNVTIDLGVGTIVDYLAFNMSGKWITIGIDDIVLNGNPKSRKFTVDSKSTSIEPIVAERAIENGSTNKATSATTDFSEHYKLTFPGTKLTWLQTVPAGYKASYSTTINGRAITGDCNEGTNAIDLYGIQGQTSAPITFTYTPVDTNSTAFTETATVPLVYLGSSDITDNFVNIDSITPQLFNNGEAVATVKATDNKAGGYVPSFYAPMKSASTSEDSELSNYSNDSIVPESGSNSILKIDEMKAKKIYLVSPNFSDVAATVTGGKLTSDLTLNYAVVPHYLMVASGPYTSADMANIVKTVPGTINTLQDSWSVSAAPALTLAGKANVKAVSTTADDLYANAVDVDVKSIGSTTYVNHKLVTFTTDMRPSGIAGIASGAVSIIGGEGFISVTGANNAVVYDFTGRTIAKANNQGIINVPSGLYIVKAGSKVSKVKVL